MMVEKQWVERIRGRRLPSFRFVAAFAIAAAFLTGSVLTGSEDGRPRVQMVAQLRPATPCLVGPGPVCVPAPPAPVTPGKQILPPQVQLPPVPRTCEVTPEEQAAADQAAQEAYQQLLLKALMEQAGQKAAGELTDPTRKVTPQDIADFVKNAALTPTDVGMAAAQAAQEMNQLGYGETTCTESDPEPLGALESSSTSANPNPGQGQPAGQMGPSSSALKGQSEPAIVEKLRMIMDWLTKRMEITIDPVTGESLSTKFTIGVIAVEKDGEIYLQPAVRGPFTSDAEMATNPVTLTNELERRRLLTAIIDDYNAAHPTDGVTLAKLGWAKKAHAEPTLISWARSRGATPIAIGATTAVCTSGCLRAISDADVFVVTSLRTTQQGASFIDPLEHFYGPDGTFTMTKDGFDSAKQVVKDNIGASRWVSPEQYERIRQGLQNITGP